MQPDDHDLYNLIITLAAEIDESPITIFHLLQDYSADDIRDAAVVADACSVTLVEALAEPRQNKTAEPAKAPIQPRASDLYPDF